MPNLKEYSYKVKLYIRGFKLIFSFEIFRMSTLVAIKMWMDCLSFCDRFRALLCSVKDLETFSDLIKSARVFVKVGDFVICPSILNYRSKLQLVSIFIDIEFFIHICFF